MSSSGLCRQPSCYRNFKGSRGLKIHLSLSKNCNSWYKVQAHSQDRSPSPGQSVVEPVTSAIELDGIQGSPVPWSSTLNSHDMHHVVPGARRGKSVTVEDAIDSDHGGLGDITGVTDDPEDLSPYSKNYTQSHPTAGKIFGKGRTILQKIDDEDDFKEERKKNLYHPFMSLQDFEMGAWLSQCNASMSQIDSFLKLSYVCLTSSVLPHTADRVYRLRSAEVSRFEPRKS